MDWRSLSKAFYRYTIVHKWYIHTKVRTFLVARKKKYSNNLYGIACSGGSDSLALLLWLYGSWYSGEDILAKASFMVLHMNHRTRGEYSYQDATFVFEVAKLLGWIVRIEQAPYIIDPTEGSLWKLRRDFLTFSGCDAIFQAHHRSDVAETMLMRLLRSSGLDGICAPRPIIRNLKGTVYLRPFLDLSKEKIVDALQELRVPWRVDASNAASFSIRNRIRNKFFPLLCFATKKSDIVANLARTRAQLEEDSNALTQWVEKVFPRIICESYNSILHWKEALYWPDTVQKRIFWRFLIKNGLKLGSKVIDKILTYIKDNKENSVKLSACSTHSMLCRTYTIFLVPNVYPINTCFIPRILTLGTRISFPEAIGSLESDIVVLNHPLRRYICNGALQCKREVYLSWLGVELVGVSFWQLGDSYKPLGLIVKRKLQDCFVDRKIPCILRHSLPLVTTLKSNNILWFVGLPPALISAVSNTTKYIIRLTYLPNKWKINE